MGAYADMTGRVCVVTGANAGIGRVTAAELARAGAHVILACRSRSKTEPVVEAIQVETGSDTVEMIELDLASLASVRSSAEALLARDLPLHVLVNNAGLAGQRGSTSDGFELAFGVNHLGHYLFTRLLLERLAASRPARIVNVSSRAHRRSNAIDFEALRRPTASFTGVPEYQVSKLANALFSSELARRLGGDAGVSTYALHPGVVASEIWRRVPWPFRSLAHLFMVSNEEGAKTSLFCATSPEIATDTGLYYDECAPRKASELVSDRELGRTLWEKSAEWTGVSVEL